MVDERAVILKAYSKSRARLIIEDDKWIKQMLSSQEEALRVLKEVSPKLYEEAVKPNDSYLPLHFQVACGAWIFILFYLILGTDAHGANQKLSCPGW